MFLPQAEYLVQLVTELSAGLSQEQGREAWAALESEVAALRRASCGMGSPAGSEAAGNFELLAQVLEQRSLQIRGWGSALLAWKSAWKGALDALAACRGLEVASAVAAWPSRFGDQVGRGGSSSSGPSGPC